VRSGDLAGQFIDSPHPLLVEHASNNTSKQHFVETKDAAKIATAHHLEAQANLNLNQKLHNYGHLISYLTLANESPKVMNCECYVSSLEKNSSVNKILLVQLRFAPSCCNKIHKAAIQEENRQEI
jgi:hypothetical protein